MELRDLSYFLHVAEERSFTRGAARAGVVQSSASAAVSRLEHEFDQVLFVRLGRTVELTEAGQALLEQARIVLAEARRTTERMSSLTGELTGLVVLGTALSTGELDVARITADFAASHPLLSVQIRVLDRGYGPSLVDGTIDLGVVPMVEQTPRGVLVEPVGRMTLDLVCSAADTWGETEALDLTEMVKRTFVDFPVGSKTRDRVDRFFRAEGVSRVVSIEVTDTATAFDLVGRGMAVAFLPASLVDHYRTVRRVRMTQPIPWIDISLISPTNRPLSAGAEALRRTLLQELRS